MTNKQDKDTQLEKGFVVANTNLINFLGSVFEDHKFCTVVSNTYNKTLHEYFIELLNYELFLEKKIHNKNKLAHDFHKIVTILYKRNLQIHIVKNVSLNDIYIQINLIKTYLFNIYKLDFKRELKLFNPSNIHLLISQAEKRIREVASSEQAEAAIGGDHRINDEPNSATKQTSQAKMMSEGLKNMLRSIVEKNNNANSRGGTIQQNATKLKGISDSFYPYHTKPKIIVSLKWILFTLCTFLLGFALVMTVSSVMTNHWWDGIIYFLSVFSFYRFFSMFRRDITEKKAPRNRYTFHILFFISLAFTTILLTIIAWGSFHFRFAEIFYTQFSTLSFLFGISLCLTLFVGLVTYIFNPKVDREKLKKIQDHFFSSFQQNFSNENDKDKTEK